MNEWFNSNRTVVYKVIAINNYVWLKKINNLKSREENLIAWITFRIIFILENSPSLA